MNLPIDVIPNTSPPRFRWQQTVSTLAGDGYVVQECEGALPPSVEWPVARLVEMVKKLQNRMTELEKQNNDLMARIAAQSDLLSKRAEGPRKGNKP